MQDVFDTLRSELRGLDGDLYLCHLFAAPAQRDALLTVYYAYADIARIPFTVNDPMVGAIRLQWWRDVLEDPSGPSAQGSPIADALQLYPVDKADMLAVINGRDAALESPDNQQQAANVGPAFVRLSLAALQGAPVAAELVETAGQGFECMRLTAPDDEALAETALRHLEAAAQGFNQLPRATRAAALAAFLPVGLMRRRAQVWPGQKSLLAYQLNLLMMNFRNRL